MIEAIALDDEVPALRVIETFCNKTEGIHLQKTFHIADEALKHINKYPVDLLFLDINMPSITGIEFYKSVQQQTMVIFTTAYSEFAVEGFNLNAVDYLLKPFTFKRFQQAVNKAIDYKKFLQQQQKGTSNFIFIRADYSLIKIDPNDILFIEGLDDYIKVYLSSQKPITARLTMKAMLEKLSASEFIRIHRSYIVPIKRIETVRGKTVQVGGQEIPIGSSYEDEFLKRLNK